MIIYKISGQNYTRFAGARARAMTARAALAEDTGHKKSAFDVTEIDLSTKKEDIIAYLNRLCEAKESGERRV